MLHINNRKLPKVLTYPTSLHGNIALTASTRSATIVSMSGYPSGANVVGRIQKTINFDSHLSLLQSCVHLRNMAKFASEILLMIKINDFRKQQIDRKDVVALIETNASAFGLGDLSVEDKDFVAYMITSSETPNFAWVLDQPQENNRLLAIEKLYAKMAAITETEFDETIGIYNAITDKVLTISEFLDQRSTDTRTSKEDDLSDEQRTARADSANFLTFGAMRQLDHIFSLVMDQTVWNSFVPARDSQSPQENVLRAEGLKTFAAYLHAVLLHPHLISAHAFLNTYNQLGSWLAPLPELEPHIKKTFDMIVLNHDYLNAAQDANAITSSLIFDSHEAIGVSLHGYPVQLLRIYGISDALQKAIDLASYAKMPIALDSLSNLGDNAIQFTLLGLPVGRHTAIKDVSALVIIGELASKQMQNSIASMNEGNSRYFTDETSDLLRRVGVKCSLEPLCKVDPVSDPTKTTSASISNNTFHYSRGRAITSYDYDYFLRRTAFLKIYAAEGLVNDFIPTHITNADLAAKLRLHSGVFEQTLIPSWMGKTGSPVTRQSLLGDRDSLNAITTILERISGHSLMYTLQTLAAPLAQEKWATTLSSFALVYISKSAKPAGVHYSMENDNKNGKGKIANINPADLGLTLVHGYGKPYGCDYPTLESKQKTSFSDSVIQLNEYVFIRLLDCAPLPTASVSLEPRFAQTVSYYYASSNSLTKDIKYLLFGDSLLNFTLFPIPLNLMEGDSKVLYDRYYTYYAQQYYLLNDMHEAPMVDKNEKLIDMHIVKKDWRFEKLSLFTEFVTFPSYSSGSEGTGHSEEPATPSIVTDLINTAEKSVIGTEKNAAEASQGGGSEKIIKADQISTDIENIKKESETKKNSGPKETSAKEEPAQEVKKQEEEKSDEDEEKDKKKKNKEDNESPLT
jgi:hypothetical protein